MQHRDPRTRVAQRHRHEDVALDLLDARTGPVSSIQVMSGHMTFWMGSSSRDGMSRGLSPICIEYSATRAARLAARTATKVAIARMSVPIAVASEAAVAQSVMVVSPGIPARTSTGRARVVLEAQEPADLATRQQHRQTDVGGIRPQLLADALLSPEQGDGHVVRGLERFPPLRVAVGADA